MSRLLSTNRSLEKPEPYEGKLSRTVLRGERSSNAPDLPDRPSDLEQRDGRAVRKGNEVAKLYADNKVDTIIYAVEKSLDAYKFNLLQNKQNFITQLKTNRLGARTIDEGGLDEKSGMNFSEYVAILSGNTDLLEKARLDKKVAGLESEKQAFSRSKWASEKKLDETHRTIDENSETISRVRGDMEMFNARVLLDKEGNKLNPIQLKGVEGSDPKVIGAKLTEIAEKARTKGEYFDIGSLYGFKIVVKTESSKSDLFEMNQNRFFIQGESGISYSYNNGKIAADPLLASMNFLNALEKMPTLKEKYERENEKIVADIPVLESVVSSTWKREEELKELKTELLTLDRKIQLSLKPIDGGDAPQESADVRQDEPKEQIVGRIKYFESGGDVSEILEFDDKEKYLQTIKKELYYNPNGFNANTISKDPELRKSVDDLFYGECGVDNPKTIEHYRNAVAIETATHTTDAPAQPVSIANGQSHPIEPSATTSYVSPQPSQTDGLSQNIGQNVAHSAQPSMGDGEPSMSAYIENADQRLQPQNRGLKM